VSLIRRTPESKDKVTLIPLKEAAETLRLSTSAIRQRKAGTDGLTLVRQGTGKRQPIFLIREEVEAHIESLVEHARARKERPVKLVYGE
jgi:hypothetical protein